MPEVLPAILETSFEYVRQKVDAVAPFVDRVQLDIADGQFVPTTTWNDYRDLHLIEHPIDIDLHLMVEKPEQWVQQWRDNSIFRYTFHFEATYDLRRTVSIITETGKEIGVALNPDTEVEVVYDILDIVDLVLIMGVEPGLQGQEFIPRTVEKVRTLREHNPKIAIGVDGHVDALTAPALVEAGANVLMSGSYIFQHDNIEEAIKTLQDIA